MRKVLLGLTGCAALIALSGDALASPPLANTCFDVGLACVNAGPDGDEAGTCMAATCVDLLDASYACGVCESADAGAVDSGAHGGSADSGSSSTSAPDSEAPGVDAATPDAGATSDAAAASDADVSDAEPEDGEATGRADAAGGAFSQGEAGASSGGDDPDAAMATIPAPPMPGCSAASPSSRTGSTPFVLLALTAAAVAGSRRRRT